MSSADPKPPANRKELFERIARGSTDAVILDEMVRLGFWPAATGLPAQPSDEVHRMMQLRERLVELHASASKLRNVAELERQAKKQRLADSKAKQKANKQKRLGQRAVAVAATAERKTRDISYLGPAVSSGLGVLTAQSSAAPTVVHPSRQSVAASLAHLQLPLWSTAADMAAAMKIPVAALRFLAFDREVSTVNHYHRFTIAKKSGGERIISAPRRKLKRAQYFILKYLLARFPLSDAAHGFAVGRSIVSNATPHVGSAVVINVDLKDFFPTVTYRRVKGLFRKLGYSEEVAIVLALLTTEPEIIETVMDGITYYVARGERRLPQGAPTSPAISNALCRRLDARLAGWCVKNGFVFTRYADDLTLSSKDGSADVGSALAVMRRLATAEGFTIHPDKIRVIRSGGRQEVTGVVVNEKPGVPRDQLRRFRAFLYHVEKDGVAGKSWHGAGHDDGLDPRRTLQRAMGFASYVHMVDPVKGAALLSRVAELLKRS